MDFKVLVVDDSAIYRSILRATAESIPGVTKVDFSSSGALALTKLSTAKYDIVLLDVEMPEMDGLETLVKIKEFDSKIEVIMVSAMNERGAGKVVQCLNQGALEFIQKPKESSREENQKFLYESISKALEAIEAYKDINKTAKATSNKTHPIDHLNMPKKIDIIAIGVSTGGPDTLNKIIPTIPGDFPLPIVLVQHMPPVFSAELARSLNEKSNINVVEASDAMPIENGTLYIAPGGKHMVIKELNGKRQTSLNEDPMENSCRPAVDVLFRSLTKTSYQNILSVILTGMGSDGTKGIEELNKHKNNWTLTQSKDTCVVYGMPRSVDEAGLTNEEVNLEDVSGRLTYFANKKG